jgi:spermidine/putrescine transport system permease protein
MIRFAGLAFLVLVALFLATPLLVIVVFSFDASRFPAIPWGGFSLQWHREALSDPAIVAAFVNSVVVAVASGTIATVIGFAAAYLDYRHQFIGKTALTGIVRLPPTIPMVVLSVAMLITAGQLGWLGHLQTIIAFHSAVAVAAAMSIIRIRLAEIGRDLEPAAHNLGASPWRSVALVIVPSCRQALIASFFLCAAISFDEFLIAWFVGGLNETVPVRILNILQGQVNPKINAIGAIVLVISATLVALAQLLVRSPLTGQIPKD